MPSFDSRLESTDYFTKALAEALDAGIPVTFFYGKVRTWALCVRLPVCVPLPNTAIPHCCVSCGGQMLSAGLIRWWLMQRGGVALFASTNLAFAVGMVRTI